MRKPKPEKVPIGLPLSDITMDQFMDIEDVVDAGGQGLAISTMRDGVWDLTASHQREYKEYSLLRRDDGGTGPAPHHIQKRSWPSNIRSQEQSLPTCSEVGS
jgi:hypothetical protein